MWKQNRLLSEIQSLQAQVVCRKLRASLQWGFLCWLVSELFYRICESMVRCKIIILMRVVVCSIFVIIFIHFLLFIFSIFLVFEFSTLVLLPHLSLMSASTSFPSLLGSFFFGVYFPSLWMHFYFSLFCSICLPGGPPHLGLQALSRAGERFLIPNFFSISISLLTARLGTPVSGQYTEMARMLCKVYKIISY